MVLDELMFRGPAKAVKKKVNNHPSNGFDQLLNFVKKTWPTHFLVARSDYNEILEVTFLSVTVKSDKQKYPYGYKVTRKYIDIDFVCKKSKRKGYMRMMEHGDIYSIYLNDSYYGHGSCNPEIPNVLFGIIQDHHNYPIWSTRCATITFLLCAPRSLPFPKDINKLIAKEIWASRFNRAVWWPDITEEEFTS